MKKVRNRVINNLGCPWLICFITLGLLPVIGATGSARGAQTSPQFAGFDFVLSEGDFWEYQWDYYRNSWAQGSGGSTLTSSGRFRVTLGSAKNISGVTAYEVEVSGKKGYGTDRDFAPRWKYLAVANNQILGSEDGSTLVTMFDAQEGAWPGGGFFATFPAGTLFVATAGQIDNDYISGSAVVASRSASQSQCQYFPGFGSICGDSSYNWTEKEYYMEGIGPVGFYYYNSFSDCGSGFCSGATWRHNVGLVASSLRGDSVDYALETEPNDSPDTAQAASLPVVIKGEASDVSDGNLLRLNEVQEI